MGALPGPWWEDGCRGSATTPLTLPHRDREPERERYRETVSERETERNRERQTERQRDRLSDKLCRWRRMKSCVTF